MFYQISLSPQVKRYAIPTYKHVIYDLPDVLRRAAEGLKTQNLRKLGNVRKVSKPHRMIARRPVPLPNRKFSQY